MVIFVAEFVDSASERQRYPAGHIVAAEQICVQMFPLAFSRHSALWQAAGPKVQSAPSPPPPFGKQT
jgi:hypothetical protein